MSDEQVKFKLDLDAKDALKGLTDVKESILKLGDSKNLQGLINGFTTMVGPIVAAGAALYAFKSALDLSLEGEQLLKVESQFKSMAETAGVSAATILEGSEKATKGMMTQNEIMQLSIKGMSLLGQSAERIPELFDLARRAGMRMGVDTQDAYEKISMAAAYGNTRILRSIGLKFDEGEAQKKYALEVGKTVATLTEQEKIQARINAVTDLGNKKFKSASQELSPIANDLKRLNVAAEELYVIFAKFTVDKLGGFFDFIVKKAGGALSEINTTLKATFGTGADKMKAEIDLLEIRIGYSKSALEIQEKSFASEAEMKPNKEYLAGLEARLSALKEIRENQEIESIQKMPTATASGAPEKDPVAERKALEEKTKFEQDMLQIQKSRIDSELATETDAVAFKRLLDDQYKNEEAQLDAAITAKKVDAMNAEGLNKAQADAEIIEMEQEKQAKLWELRLRQKDAEKDLYENQLKNAHGVGEAFSAAAQKAAKEQSNFANQGTFVYSSMTSHATKFFRALGDGSKSAADAMKTFLFGFLGDYAAKKGEVLLAEGIAMLASYQPGGGVLVAEGGALIALGAAISGMGGGGGSGGGSSGGGGSVAAAGNPDFGKPTAQEQQKKTVTVQVMGHYFETEQTQRKLMDMLRAETDATEYRYEQVPVR